jgi:hypothetical protein
MSVTFGLAMACAFARAGFSHRITTSKNGSRPFKMKGGSRESKRTFQEAFRLARGMGLIGGYWTWSSRDGCRPDWVLVVTVAPIEQTASAHWPFE